MGRLASRATAAAWQQRIGRWRQSGLSIAEFCRRERLTQPSFFAWRKRLKDEDAARQRIQPPSRTHASGNSPFIELTPPAWNPPGSVQIALPGGAVVTLPPNASPELVVLAIRAAVPAPAEDQPC